MGMHNIVGSSSKAYKKSLKQWNKTRPNTNLYNAEEELKSVQALVQEDSMNEELVDKEITLQEAVRKMRFQEEVHLQQRAKCVWLKEGDRWTNIFHASVRACQHRSSPTALLYSDDKLTTDDREMAKRAIEYYMSLYNQTDYMSTLPTTTCKRLVT